MQEHRKTVKRCSTQLKSTNVSVAYYILLVYTDRAYIVFVFSYTVYFTIYNNLVMCSQYKKLLGACTITDRNISIITFYIKLLPI